MRSLNGRIRSGFQQVKNKSFMELLRNDRIIFADHFSSPQHPQANFLNRRSLWRL
ncbi:MAG: hypothetical protein RM347_022455 [Nostoc sp. ChiQUE02]|uniref:hypothetical protein n=1 Tax=Nostoc sp. ChiQUE02 TaxID=3075377 RepID=UPI002AD4E708|nr:hypothetical protein [Nostoc sp. ChiQUE02]